MAIDVVLKDRNGNDLNVGSKLYEHKLYIASTGEEKGIDLIRFYSYSNTVYDTYNEFYNNFANITRIQGTICNYWDETDSGIGFVSFTSNSVGTNYITIPVDEIEVFMHQVYEVI